jgi:hypothetical protein
MKRFLSALPGARLARDLLLRRSPSYRGVRRHPPGHFYSPLLDLERFATHAEEFLDPNARLWGGVDLCGAKQTALLEEFVNRGLPFALPSEPEAGWRYYSKNEYFRFGDGFSLASMLQDFRPRRIVEIGSGFSTALLLDAAQRLGLALQLTAIEPFPKRLRELLRTDDTVDIRILEQRVQDVSQTVFDELAANDLLFIDSSHVAKVGSDVAEIFLRILPGLQPGVIVHFHDIFFPEAYPEMWLRDGCAWNEGLFLRAFLQFNRAFEIVLFNAFVAQHARERLEPMLPRFFAHPGGSMYLRRLE